MGVDLKEQGTNVFNLTIPEAPHKTLDVASLVPEYAWDRFTSELGRLQNSNFNTFLEMYMHLAVVERSRFSKEHDAWFINQHPRHQENMQNIVRSPGAYLLGNLPYKIAFGDIIKIPTLDGTRIRRAKKEAMRDASDADSFLSRRLEDRIKNLRYLIAYSLEAPDESQIVQLNREKLSLDITDNILNAETNDLLNYFCYLKLYFGEDLASPDLKQAVISRGVEFLKSITSNPNFLLLEQAARVMFAIKVIAAEEAVFTPKGLDLIMHKDDVMQETVLPLERSF